MAEIKVICPECGKRVSLRGLNGHLRFEHDYDLDRARRMAAGIQVDSAQNRVEQDVMDAIVTTTFLLRNEAMQASVAELDPLIVQVCFDSLQDLVDNAAALSAGDDRIELFRF